MEAYLIAFVISACLMTFSFMVYSIFKGRIGMMLLQFALTILNIGNAIIIIERYIK